MTFQTFHSLSNALIHTMARQELQALNWPTSLRLEYGFSWSQDDGVTLWGDLSCQDLLRIIPGLRARRYLSRADARALVSAVQLHAVTARIAPMQSWYRHSGGARMILEGFPDAMERLENCLLKALLEQYECLCNSVKNLGYRLTDGTSPTEYGEVLFTRQTENTPSPRRRLTRVIVGTVIPLTAPRPEGRGFPLQQAEPKPLYAIQDLQALHGLTLPARQL
jgi:hypothetical protein